MVTPLHYMTAEGSGTILFPFLTLQGVLVPSRQTVEREIRPGVDGIGLWKTGKRGEPFRIATSLDCATVAAAGQVFAAYHASITSKKNLYYAGAFWGTVLIYDVVMREVRKLTTRVGGINGSGSSGAMLFAEWTIETLHSP